MRFESVKPMLWMLENENLPVIIYICNYALHNLTINWEQLFSLSLSLEQALKSLLLLVKWLAATGIGFVERKQQDYKHTSV